VELRSITACIRVGKARTRQKALSVYLPGLRLFKVNCLDSKPPLEILPPLKLGTNSAKRQCFTWKGKLSWNASVIPMVPVSIDAQYALRDCIPQTVLIVTVTSMTTSISMKTAINNHGIAGFRTVASMMALLNSSHCAYRSKNGAVKLRPGDWRML